MKTNINVTSFEEILERETALRDNSPEHTLDWYTYNNRVLLLQEVEDLFTKEKPAAAKPAAAKKVDEPGEKVVDKTEDTEDKAVTKK